MLTRSIWVVIAVVAAIPALGNTVTAADADIQTALSSGFTLLGYNVSNIGTSLITGSVGVGSSAGTITGFDPTGSATGAVYAPGSPTGAAAYNDFLAAYIAALGLTGGTPLAAGLPSEVFTAAEGVNVYTLPAGGTSTTSGTHLTFNANGNPNAVFIIQVPGAFTVNGSITFSLVNGAKADNIIWVVGTGATINVGSSGPITFDGNILAGSAFTMSVSPDGIGTLTGTINGCVFSDRGTNTLAGTTDITGCSGDISLEKDPASDPVPESGTTALFTCSLLGLGFLLRRPVCKS